MPRMRIRASDIGSGQHKAMTCGPCRELEKSFGAGLGSLTECSAVGNDHSREPWQTKMRSSADWFIPKAVRLRELRELKCGDGFNQKFQSPQLLFQLS